jgi:hypothetical protein
LLNPQTAIKPPTNFFTFSSQFSCTEFSSGGARDRLHPASGVHILSNSDGIPQPIKEGQEIPMNEQSNVVAIYNTHTQAEDALHKLSTASFDIKKISILGKGYHTEENVVGYYTTGDRMKHWGGLGAFWGGLWGLLFGAGLFLIPGLGPVLVAGPILAAVVGALESAVVVGGLSALTAGLVSLGIPKEQSIKYEAELKADRYLLVAHGTPDEVERARAILAETAPVSLETHQPAAA